MNNMIAFLELKYGNINGGYPNYFVISEASMLIFDPQLNKVFVETFNFTADLDIIFFNTKVNDLGHTISRLKYVQNLKTRKKSRHDEEFKLEDDKLDEAFAKSRDVKKHLSRFFQRVMRKYRIDNIITFDGNRDLFLLEKSGVKFKYQKMYDIQREINKECSYLFSLKKLAVVIGFDHNHTSLKSNNVEFHIHPIAANQIKPKSAAKDAAKLLMLYQEFNNYRDDFMLKAALVVNKIQQLEAAQAAEKN